MNAHVVAVSANPLHGFSKDMRAEVRLLVGLGVEGDCHAGATTQHLYRKRRTPRAANLCQVHLLHEELFADLHALGIAVAPGAMGDNVTTSGIDLMGLPRGARLALGAQAIVEITGVRDPCRQMDGFAPGLMQACLPRDATGTKVRNAGVMAVVIAGGVVRAGDAITVTLPPGKRLPLLPV